MDHSSQSRHYEYERDSVEKFRRRPSTTRQSQQDEFISKNIPRKYEEGMSVSRRSSRRRSSSRSSIRPGKYGKPDTTSRYLENSVVAFDEFGEAPTALKLYEFRDKVRSAEKLKRNVVIKIEVSPAAGSCLAGSIEIMIAGFVIAAN